jgi:hypothetical protein
MKLFFYKTIISVFLTAFIPLQVINAKSIEPVKKSVETSEKIEVKKIEDIKIDIHQTIKVLENIDLQAQELFLSSELQKKWHDWKEKKQEQFLLYVAKHLDPDEIVLFQELSFEMQWKIIVKLQKGMIHDVKVYFLKQIENFQKYRPI